MNCDYCDSELPPSYVPKVDHRGRPCEAVCRRCDLSHMQERAQRLGLSPLVPIKPVTVH